MFTFWHYYLLKLLPSETITFSDATLSDIKVVLCYVLSQYLKSMYKTVYIHQQYMQVSVQLTNCKCRSVYNNQHHMQSGKN